MRGGAIAHFTSGQLNIALIILRKESESSNKIMSGTFRMQSEESGKDSRWVISDV